MPKKQTKLDLKRVRELRRQQGLNQSEFWSKYGVFQSGGSRYEGDRKIPTPVAILIWLHQTGKVSDDDLEEALKETPS